VAIAENNLRPDLFYRLGVVFIPIPPLRDRKEDIVLLARHFLAKHSRALNRQVTDISGDVLALFNDYDWPGNVRELEHVIEGAINMVVSSRTIERRHLQSHLTTWRRLRGQPGCHSTARGRFILRWRRPKQATEGTLVRRTPGGIGMAGGRGKRVVGRPGCPGRSGARRSAGCSPGKYHPGGGKHRHFPAAVQL
jgi:DNA-binding NtrC family response regulator